jgi:hypothetical protein
MLPAIKSILAGLTPTSSNPKPPASVSASAPDSIAAQVVKKHREMSQGRTEAQVKRLRAELAAAERAFTEAETAEGECLVEARDATAATETRRKADDRVRAVKAALSVAIEKNQTALDALTDAERAEAVASDDADVATAKAAAVTLEEVLGGVLKNAVDELAHCLANVKARSEGNPGVGSALIDFNLWFKVYLDRSCAVLIPGGRTYSQVLDRDGKKFSEWVGAIEYAMTYRRRKS